LTRQTEKDQNSSIKPQHVLAIETPDSGSDLRLWNGRDLVCHKMPVKIQPVRFGWLNSDTEQWRVGRIAREGADGDGTRSVEAIVLQNDDGLRLAGVVFAASDLPDFAAPHSVGDSETASMKR